MGKLMRMCLAARLAALLVPSLLCLPAIFAQTNPPPFDPHEMVTREPRTLSRVADRKVALDLLDRTRQNYNLRDITTPYELKVSFETNGAAQSEGAGAMDEVSDGGSHWRWTAELQGVHVTRIGSDGRVYGTNASEPVPLRVQMVRAALHWPIARNASASAIRAEDVRA